MKKLSLLFASVLSATLSNAQNSNDTTKQVLLDTLTVTAPAAPPVYRASAARVWDIKNTRIALKFNWLEKTADAREWIKLRPYFYATDTMVLDAKSMRIDSVMLVDKKGNTKLNYTYDKDELKIHFGKEYKMNDNQLIALKEFAQLHGSNWKNELNLLFYSGKDTGLLRQIRNNYLPVVMSKNFKI